MTLAVPSNVADHLLEKIVGGDIKIAGGSRRSHSTSPTETTGVPGLVGPASGGVPSPRNSGGEQAVRHKPQAAWSGLGSDMEVVTIAETLHLMSCTGRSLRGEWASPRHEAEFPSPVSRWAPSECSMGGLTAPCSGLPTIPPNKHLPAHARPAEMKEEVSERDTRAGMDDKSMLESPQEHEIAAALFDLANVASAGQLEGRGESDAPSRPGSGSPAASAKRGAAGEGAAAETQTRKRPRKPNRNLDAYHGYQGETPG